MKTARELLELDPLVYANYHTYQFNAYCVKCSFKKGVPARLLQNSEMLYNWYCAIWKRYENYFLDRYADYAKAGIKNQDIYWDLFSDEVVKEIENFYPSAILEDLYKKHYEKINSKIA